MGDSLHHNSEVPTMISVEEGPWVLWEAGHHNETTHEPPMRASRVSMGLKGRGPVMTTIRVLTKSDTMPNLPACNCGEMNISNARFDSWKIM
jgi:hypothetical protein